MFEKLCGNMSSVGGSDFIVFRQNYFGRGLQPRSLGEWGSFEGGIACTQIFILSYKTTVTNVVETKFLIAKI